jgi:hypothetical protein
VVKTKSKRACPVCGTLLPDNSESCPVCVLRGALGNEQTVSQSVGSTHSPSEFRFEHYEVLTRDDGTPLELGRGAMGVTYKALDVNLRCAVALKVINARLIGDESARRRSVREARAAASVRHPNAEMVTLHQTSKRFVVLWNARVIGLLAIAMVVLQMVLLILLMLGQISN